MHNGSLSVWVTGSLVTASDPLSALECIAQLKLQENDTSSIFRATCVPCYEHDVRLSVRL